LPLGYPWRFKNILQLNWNRKLLNYVSWSSSSFVFPVWRHRLQHVNKSSSAYFKTFIQQIRYFCDLSQYSNGFVYWSLICAQKYWRFYVMYNCILTWELVSVLLRQEPLEIFHMRICRSAVPPPLASRLDCQGHHAIAFEKKAHTFIGTWQHPQQRFL